MPDRIQAVIAANGGHHEVFPNPVMIRWRGLAFKKHIGGYEKV